MKTGSSTLGLSVLAGIAFAAWLVFGLVDSRGWSAAPVFPGVPVLSGFAPDGGGAFVSEETPSGGHTLAQVVSVQPNSTYEVRLDLDGVPDPGVRLHADLYAPGFDEPRSERSVALGTGDAGRELSFVLPVGDPPPEVLVRLFYSGPPGLVVSNIRIARTKAWLRAVLGWSGWLAAFLGISAAAAALADDDVWVWRQWRRDGWSSGAGVATVIGAYVVSVVFRFLQYDATPYWSGDEYAYKSIAAAIWEFGGMAALRPEQIGHAVDLPSPLYPYAIAPAFALGAEFYSGVRLINAALMSAAIFPAYAIARRFWNDGWAVLIAVYAICVPSMGLGAYAVTETIFYPVMLAAVWAMIRALPRPSVRPQILVGALVALAMNARPTGTFLIPAYLLAWMAYALVRGESGRVFRRPTWLWMLGSLGVLHALLQWCFRPSTSNALGVYGDLPFADRVAVFLDAWAVDPAGPGRLVLGHVLTVAIPYALPLVLMVALVPVYRRLLAPRRAELSLVVVAVAVASALIGFTLVFTLYASTFDLGGIDRWHARYYFAVGPLVLMAGVVLARRAREEAPVIRWGVVAGTVVVVLGGALALFASPIPSLPWFGSTVDGMPVQWARNWPEYYVLFAVLTVVVAVQWATRVPAAARFSVAGLLVWLILANAGVAKETRMGMPNPAMACGRGLAELVSSSSRSFAVFGEHRAALVGLGFWLPRTPTLTRVVSSQARLDEWVRLASSELVLVNGEGVPAPSGGRLIETSGACRAYAMDD